MTDLQPAPAPAASTSVPAIEVRNVSKRFVLGARSKSLRDRLTATTGNNAALESDFWAVKDVSVKHSYGTASCQIRNTN